MERNHWNIPNDMNYEKLSWVYFSLYDIEEKDQFDMA